MDEEVPPEVRELLDRMTDELREDLDAIGVHLDGAMLAASEDSTRLVIMGRLGPAAFLDRVVRPEQETVDDDFADIAEATIDESYEQTLQALLEDGDQ